MLNFDIYKDEKHNLTIKAGRSRVSCVHELFSVHNIHKTDDKLKNLQHKL